MMRYFFPVTVVAVVVSAATFQQNAVLSSSADRCTTIAVGAKAGVEGPMLTHTSDCADCDFRLSKVPARDWPAGSKRPLYLYKSNYPLNVIPNRGETWLPENLEGLPEQISIWNHTNPTTGFVPQVNHTYALFESQYGIMNEHQLAIGESTCAARFWTSPSTAGGMARIEVRQMSQIALERTKSAREAVQMMGDLAVKYGYYAADWGGGDGSFGEGGEALTVIDTKEAWVFHVLGDDTGSSAVWVAQRVPDGHVAAVANQFVIRGVDPNSDDFMYSANLWEVAIRNQLWAYGDDDLDFLKTFGLPRAHTPYATRRIWRIFSLVSPSTILPSSTNMWGDDYPFSVKADVALTPQDMMRIQRDHYEGTQFDLTQGLAAGPYGDPNRWDVTPVDNMTAYTMVQGAYERSISLFRTSYSIVAQARAAVPDEFSLLWFAQYAPATSSYTPFYVVTESLPKPYTTGSLFKYDSSVSFWNFCAAGNYAGRFYKYAIQDINVLQEQLMTAAMAAVKQTEATLIASSADSQTMVKTLTDLSIAQGMAVSSAWRDLLPQLITKYHDGYKALDLTSADISMQTMFFPKFWLDATGYWNNKPNLGPGVLLFDSNPTAPATAVEEAASATLLLTTVITTAIVSSLLTLLVAGYLMRSYNKNMNGVTARHEYVEINNL